MAQPTLTAAEYFAEAINTSGLTQKEIARRAGLASPNVISMWKKGDSNIPVKRVPALAAACGIESGEFLGVVLREYQPEVWDVIRQTYDL